MIKKKLVFLTNIIPHYREDVFNYLCQYYDVTVIYDRKIPDDYYGTSASRIRFSYIYASNRFETILKILKIKPDFIISSELGYRTSIAAILSLTGEFKLIAHADLSQDSEIKTHPIKHAFRKIISKTFDGVIVNGDSGYLYVKHKMNYAGKIYKIPYGPSESFYGRKSRSQSHGKPRRIVYVGKLTERKGINDVIQALINSKLELNLVGSGEMEDVIRDKANKLGVKVVFHGPLDNSKLPHLFSEMDFFIFPTRGETWGVAPLEAMACGLPVISSQYCPSMKEAISKNGKDGWIYSNAEDLGSIIANLGAIDDNDLRKMQESAYSSALAFNPRLISDLYLEFLERLQ